jgi:hypothetical protein
MMLSMQLILLMPLTLPFFNVNTIVDDVEDVDVVNTIRVVKILTLLTVLMRLMSSMLFNTVDSIKTGIN